MNILFQKIIKDYKKANKSRKIKLLEKYGFTSEDLFLTYLNNEDNTTVVDTNTTKSLDIVIAFDLTGSMSAYRDAVRKVSKQFVEELFDKIPNLNMEIVGFGDYCDGKDMFQTSGLTNDKNSLISFINTCKNTYGGDGDEFYEYVIQQVVRNTKWRSNSNKVFVLLGDADPHNVGYRYNNKTHNVSWYDEVQNAVASNVNIHTVYVDTGCNAKSFYKSVADTTGGAFLEFKHIDKLPSILQGIAYSKGNVEELQTQYEKSIVENDVVLTGYYKTIIETI